jgi:hypothetical protein
MKPIDVGKITVTPFVFDTITEIKIEKRLNEHSTLYVCGIIKDESKFTPVTSMTEGSNIKCENDGTVYFDGVLQNIDVTCLEGVYHLKVYAVSNTVLLDIVKHKRAFQNNGEDYKSIVEKVIADAGASVTYNADPMTVENIILQYNETDWEFAKRLASHTQDVLIPITASIPSFHFGATDSGGAELATGNFGTSRDFDALRSMVSQIDPLTADDVTLYTVETDEYLCDLGEKFTLNGADLRVYRLSLSLVESAITIKYTLCGKRAVSGPKLYNRTITGLILDGKVVEVKNDTLKLDLGVDIERGVELDTDERHLYKYASGYTMEDHTGWYVMPEENDTVQLVFPLEDEKYAYATSSVRRETTDRTIDHMVKYLRTSYGRELKMDKDEILLTAVDNDTFIRIHKANGEEGKSLGIEIITPNRISINSGSKVFISSADDMSITSGKNLYIEAKDNIHMVCGGNSMELDEKDGKGIIMSTDKEYHLLSEKDMVVESKLNMGIKSKEDINVTSSDKQIIVGADRKIEIACAGSSIMMDTSSMDIRSLMIKEN